MGPSAVGDIFLLASDGVWAAGTQYELGYQLGLLASGQCDANACAEALLDAALAAGSADNVSALVVQLAELPPQDLRDSLSSIVHLPLPPRLKPGQLIDGMAVEELVHASGTTLLYRVRDQASGRTLALKTLAPERAGDAQERTAFGHEEWLARRAVARFFAQVINPQVRNYLYYLTTWHAGASLQQHLDAGRHFTVPEVVTLGEQLMRALGALHRRSIIHRDIKPANVHLGDDGQLRLLDFGVAQSGMIDGVDGAPLAGTPSFLAPEQFDQAGASASTDLYAAGVTLFLLLTRHYPYGEVEPFQRPRFGQATSASRYRPDTPAWLDNVLDKAVAADPAERFETAEECLLALERGATRPLPARKPVPLVQRGLEAGWRPLALVSLLLNCILLIIRMLG